MLGTVYLNYKDLLGTVEQHMVSDALGTGFVEFSSPYSIRGLVKITGTHMEFLAILSDDPGNGNFRAFLNDCKERMEQISIWEVWNPRFYATLKRYGFKRSTTSDSTGMRWTKTSSTSSG